MKQSRNRQLANRKTNIKQQAPLPLGETRMLKVKDKYILLGILAIVFTLVYVSTFDPKLDLNGDNATYLSLAKRISEGLGYSNVSSTGILTPSSHFPPGYSFFLSIFMFSGINNLIFFKCLNGLLLFTSLLGLFYLVRKITDNISLAFSSVLLAIFCPSVLHFSSIVMSEMLFLFCSVVFFVSLLLYDRQPECRIKAFWTSPWFYVSIISVIAAYYIRAVGAALIFGLVIFYLFRKEWLQTLSAIGGSVLLILPWSLRNAVHGIESRYFGTIMTVNPWRPELGSISSTGEMVNKMIVNFDETVIKGFKEILFPFMTIDYETRSGFWAIIGGLIIVAIVFYGAWNLKKLRWAMITYLFGQIGLFMLWHGGNGSRYVVPLAPVLFICFYVGLFYMVNLKVKKQSKLMHNIPYAFLLFLLPIYPSVKAQASIAKEPYPPAYENYFTIAKEMDRQSLKNTVCCCRKPELFSYFADNIYAVNYKYTLDPNELIKDLVDKNVDYVILEQLGYSSTGRYLYPAIRANMNLFTLVWQLPNPDTYLLKFDRIRAQEKLTNVGTK
jgi:hypothetical protein